MTRAREDVNIQNIKSPNGGMRTRYKSPEWGNENKIQSLERGSRKWYKGQKVRNGGTTNKMQTPTGVCLEM